MLASIVTRALPATICVGILGLACLGAVPAAATTAVLPADESLAERAAAVVVAVVGQPMPGRGLVPETDYVLRSVEVIAGDPTLRTDRLRLPGGRMLDGRGLAIAGLPRLRTGDRILAFVVPRGDGVVSPVDLMLGMFRVEQRGGRDVAYRELTGLRLLPRADGLGTADAPRDLDAFRGWLRDLEAGHPRAKDYFLPAPEGALPGGKFGLTGSSSLPAPLGCGATGGHNVRWSVFDVGESLAWHRHQDGLGLLANDGAEAFGAALAAWSDTGNSPVTLVDAGTNSLAAGLLAMDGANTVLTGDPNASLPGSFTGTGLLALGGAWLDCETTVPWGGLLVHPVLEADIVLQDGIELFFAGSDDPEAAAAELFSHELGHTLGFAHSDDENALMYGLIHDDGRGAALSEDDLAGLRLLYPLPPVSDPPDGPPSVPTNVVIFGSGRTITLGWRLDGPAAAVRIERRIEQGDYALHRTVGAVESFIDQDLLPGTTYSYRLQAFSAFGASDKSGEVTLTTDGSIAPARPTNLRYAPLDTTTIRLSWQDNAPDELFFRVELQAGGMWQPVGSAVPANQTTVDIGGLDNTLVYRFRVRAVGVFGASEPSNIAASSPLGDETTCTVSDERLCLLSGRFAITVRFRDPDPGGLVRSARAVPETDKTGRMWFFNAANTELIVKMIDGTTANGHAWMFYGGLSDLEYWIDIRDTRTGVERTYHNEPGALCGLADTRAFVLEPEPPPLPPGPPGSPPPAVAIEPPGVPAAATSAKQSSFGGPCVPDEETLCLLDGRFAVRVDFVNQHADDTPGVGKAIAGGDKTGFFYFFNLLNTELVVKMLDGRGNNGHFWTFYGGLSDVAYEITITDSETGVTRAFVNQPGEICGGKDTRAFAELPVTNPPGTQPPDA